MSFEPVSAKMAALWLWDVFGEKISSLGASAIKAQWKKFNWLGAENEYRSRVHSQLSTIRLLGNATPIDVESIYTDVEVLDKLSAMRRFNFEDIKGKPIDYDPFNLQARRMSALEIVKGHNRTYILGKPGAGKTTFLKHLAMLACRGQLTETPIYISLKEWSDSRMDLLEFICGQFKICGFPDAKVVVEYLLSNGKALVLLDGLDEVNLPIAPNLLNRNFQPDAPNSVWTSDITYIQTDEGWLYLAVVLDLYSRQVVGWSMQAHMQTSLVADALRMAWFRRRPEPGLICAQACKAMQVCCLEYLLRKHGGSLLVKLQS